jgi:hypothetical protein
MYVDIMLRINTPDIHSSSSHTPIKLQRSVHSRHSYKQGKPQVRLHSDAQKKQNPYAHLKITRIKHFYSSYSFSSCANLKAETPFTPQCTTYPLRPLSRLSKETRASHTQADHMILGAPTSSTLSSDQARSPIGVSSASH